MNLPTLNVMMQWQVFVLLHLHSDIISAMRMAHSEISAWKFHWPETNKLLYMLSQPWGL